MSDLHTRFQSLDDVSTPNLWHEIEERAMATQSAPRSRQWVLIAVILLLALAIGGAALVGSGIVKLPVSVETSPTPSSAPESATPSSTPVAPTAPAWTATANMNWARTGHTSTLLADGRVLVAGGSDSARTLFLAEVYDPASGTWTTTADNMREARSGHTATLLADGRVLVAGGEHISGGPVSAELYDPNNGSWTAAGGTGMPSGGQTATLLVDGTVLVAGGGTAELYDPSSGTWRATGNMIAGRRDYATTLLANGKVLVAGGGSDNSLASAELYDPVSGTWTATGSMTEGRTFITATLLPDGKVLVAGGWAITNGAVVQLASAELYDPVSGTWTATGSMSESRGRFPTATLLPNGTVLVAGGCCGAGSNFLTSAELYDPISGTWTRTASMNDAHFDHTATLLANGTVLVAGGLADEGDPSTVLATAELYHPGSGN
jgi:hypothetical protein